MIHFRATGRAAYARTDEPLTTGSVGIPVDVSLSSDFDGLQAVMVFRSGDTSADVALLGQDVVVPPQVLTGRVLSMGVYASSTDGTVAIPTVWCDVGLIRGSVATEFDPAEPTPGWSAQIQAWAEDAADSATKAAGVADSIRADMDEFNETSATVLADAQAATTAANGAATNANAAASAANASASAAGAATADAITATRAANTAASAVSDAATLATNAAGVATTAAGNADTATAAARQAASDANTATVSANAAASAASAATTDTENATAAARQATADATTATVGANTAAAAANAAADGANDAAGAANAATSAASTAASQATAAANNANSKANAANTAANNANAATSAANDATTRANAAIDAMGDISEQAVPVMSADVRGGAKIQPDSGLEIAGTDNLQVRLALESEGDVRGGLAQVTAKGHAEQVSTTGKNLLPNNATSQTLNGITFDVRSDGSIYVHGTTGSRHAQLTVGNVSISEGTYTISKGENTNASIEFYVSGIPSLNSTTTPRTATIDSAITNAPVFLYVAANKTVDDVIKPQLELGSTATDYEPYTGGAPSPSPDYPQEIQVVRGRNLYDGTRVAGYVSSDGSIVEPENYSHSNAIAVESGKSYVWSGLSGFNHVKRVHACDANGNWISSIAMMQANAGTTYNIGFEVPAGVHYVMGTFHNSDSQLQLTLGSTPQPYVPYGHVGMEVRQGSTVLSTTPIPLPQRGWVAGLRDGTADVLTLDGAGKCEWTLPTSEVVVNGGMTEFNSGDGYANTNCVMFTGDSVGVNSNRLNILLSHFRAGSVSDGRNSNRGYITADGTRLMLVDDGTTFTDLATVNAWLSTHPVTVLYLLATPVTEDCGYCEDWPTDIPDSATISIPELDAVNIKYFIDSAVTELARQWHDRIAYERTIATQDALASVAPIEHSPAEYNHSIGELITYDGALYRVIAAIARGESITIGTNVTATTVAEQLAALQ